MATPRLRVGRVSCILSAVSQMIARSVVSQDRASIWKKGQQVSAKSGAQVDRPQWLTCARNNKTSNDA